MTPRNFAMFPTSHFRVLKRGSHKLGVPLSYHPYKLDHYFIPNIKFDLLGSPGFRWISKERKPYCNVVSNIRDMLMTLGIEISTTGEPDAVGQQIEKEL